MGKLQPTPVFLPGKSHGQRSLVGYSPWGRKESDTTEQLNNKKHVFRCLRIARTKQRNSMQVIQVAPHSKCCWGFQHQASPCPQEGFSPSSFIAAKLCKGVELTQKMTAFSFSWQMSPLACLPESKPQTVKVPEYPQRRLERIAIISCLWSVLFLITVILLLAIFQVPAWG